MVALVPLDRLFHTSRSAHHWRRVATETYCCSLVCRWPRVCLELRRNWPWGLPTESMVATGYREEWLNAAKVQTQEGCSCSAALEPGVSPDAPAASWHYVGRQAVLGSHPCLNQQPHAAVGRS